MKKHQRQTNQLGYVGFLDYRPHVQRANGAGGPLVITVYQSKAAAKRAYADVRTVHLVFDAAGRGNERKTRGE